MRGLTKLNTALPDDRRSATQGSPCPTDRMPATQPNRRGGDGESVGNVYTRAGGNEGAGTHRSGVAASSARRPRAGRGGALDRRAAGRGGEALPKLQQLIQGAVRPALRGRRWTRSLARRGVRLRRHRREGHPVHGRRGVGAHVVPGIRANRRSHDRYRRGCARRRQGPRPGAGVRQERKAPGDVEHPRRAADRGGRGGSRVPARLGRARLGRRRAIRCRSRRGSLVGDPAGQLPRSRLHRRPHDVDQRARRGPHGQRVSGGHLDAEPRRRRGGLPHPASQGSVRIPGPAGKRRGGTLLAHRGSDRLGMAQQRGGHVVLAALLQLRSATRAGGGTRRPQRLGRRLQLVPEGDGDAGRIVPEQGNG